MHFPILVSARYQFGLSGQNDSDRIIVLKFQCSAARIVYMLWASFSAENNFATRHKHKHKRHSAPSKHFSHNRANK